MDNSAFAFDPVTNLGVHVATDPKDVTVQIAEAKLMNRLVVGDPVPEAIKFTHWSVNLGASLWLQFGKGTPQSMGPKRRLVARTEQKSPEAERQFCDDTSGCLGLAVTAQAVAGRPYVLESVPVKGSARILIPFAGEVPRRVPGTETAVKSVSKDDLKMSQDFKEGGANTCVPFVQVKG